LGVEQIERWIEIVVNVSPNCVNTAPAKERQSSEREQAIELAIAVTANVRLHGFILFLTKKYTEGRSKLYTNAPSLCILFYTLLYEQNLIM